MIDSDLDDIDPLNQSRRITKHSKKNSSRGGNSKRDVISKAFKSVERGGGSYSASNGARQMYQQ